MREFELDPEKNIVGTSGDGASAMVAFGREIASEYIQCNDHGVHLGITKILYSKKNVTDEDFVDEDFFIECGSDDDSLDSEEFDDHNANLEFNELDEQIDFDFQGTIRNLRKIVLLFQRSSVKNEILQGFVKRINNGKELKLKIDSKTRWNSLHDACERFLKLLGPVQEALEHFEKGFMWTDDDTKTLEMIVNALGPAKLAVQYLSKKSVNLIESSTTINFLLNKLQENPEILSQNIFIAIKAKIDKRRHCVLESLINYLNDADSINNSNHFDIATVSMMNKFAVKMMERLFASENNDCAILEPQQIEDINSSSHKSIAEQLEHALEASRNVTNTQKIKNVDLKKEMQVYAKTKNRSCTLDRLFEALKTIQATSVAAERRFSETNLLVSKIRNRLCDENINAISFLKCYFRNKELK